MGTRPFEEPEPCNADTQVLVERKTPLQVYCDYVTDAKGNQTPILLCAETDEDDEKVSFYSPNYTSPFFDWLEDLAVDQDGDDRNVIVIFHNLKGFDSMFILQHCYATHREVRSDHRRNQDPVTDIRAIDVQRLAVLSPIPSGQLSCHLQDQ